MDIALLDRAFVHHVARNTEKPHLDVRRRGLLLCNLIQLESKIPSEHVDAVGFGRVLAGANRALELGRDLRHIADTDRSINGTDVDHSPGFHAMEPSIAVQWGSLGELEDKLDVGTLTLCRFVVTKLSSSPKLPLVLAEI